MKTCIINFANALGWYRMGQERLRASLRAVNFEGATHFYQYETQLPGCPEHKYVPYGFKPYALREAVQLGCEVILWVDSSVWAIKPIEPIFEHIAEHGHLFFYNGNCATQTSDACMQGFGMCREQLRITPHLMGICMGWDMRRLKCQLFLERWLEKANDGVSFPGSWTNKNHEVSDDDTVVGHRHDQAVAALLAWQLDMKTIPAHETLFAYYQNPQGTTYAKNPTLEMIRPKVVMVAQGM